MTTLVVQKKPESQQSTLPAPTAQQIDWSQTAVGIFKKIYASEEFETQDDFKTDLENLFTRATVVLRNSKPKCDLLKSNQETLNKHLKDVYETIVRWRKIAAPSKVVILLVTSPIFKALAQRDESEQKDDVEENQKNFHFYKKYLAPNQLKGLPELQSNEAVIDWLAHVTLSINARQTLTKIREPMEKFPEQTRQQAMDGIAAAAHHLINAGLTGEDGKLLVDFFLNKKFQLFWENSSAALEKCDLALLDNISLLESEKYSMEQPQSGDFDMNDINQIISKAVGAYELTNDEFSLLCAFLKNMKVQTFWKNSLYPLLEKYGQPMRERYEATLPLWLNKLIAASKK